ncbi:unnamed protein product [Kluyveromyces dobzhanskii CBS 2104]|uniref:WGS project CCBQ000000000 data, contig MAT n=1 Tax=Kluyveromyces dobzhanskii CBS 2104 TaxID=1427455 RepID=A0A0A8L1H8_9SACH|nr:unnamed protein product [Kluyveromyces dobzhanskii CBS 2104]
MAIYTSGKPSDDSEPVQNDPKFYTRPSLGLKLWGPLVPSSDNTAGLWSLVAIQTGLGLFLMHRFRKLGKKWVKRDIADFPSLNRFSTTHGDMYMTRHIPVQFGGTHSFSIRVGTRTGFWYSERFRTIRRATYLLTGALILSQSMLEVSRLTLLKYDPWAEEAKCVREKQFFNDIVKYYHEGVDSTKFKAKDELSGQTISLNLPEVKQSIAVARAQAQAENLVTRWFGPLDYKPQSFSDFLDKLEYYLNMTDFLNNLRRQKKNDEIDSELTKLVDDNKRNRERIHTLMVHAPPRSIRTSQEAQGMFGIRKVLLHHDTESSNDIPLTEIWAIYNPWTNLALDTALSIKFFPSVIFNEDYYEHQKRLKDSENVSSVDNDNEKKDID